MKSPAFALLLLLAASASASEDRTITKVVKMLQEMLDRSKEDGDKEREVYAKFKCYGDNTKKEKEESIQKLTDSIDQLENDIESLQSESGSLSLESAQLSQDITANEASREQAKTLRERGHEAFVAEETDLVTAGEQMGTAVEALSALGADKFLQEQSNGKVGFTKLRASVKQALVAARTFITPAQQRKVEAFFQAPATQAKAGGIVGILKQMQETFATNLDNARSAEAAAVEANKKFIANLEEDHATMTDSLDKKQAKLGDNDGQLSTKKTQREENIKQKEDDEAFLADLVKTMKEKAKEYGERQLLRTNEDAAIAKAIAILNSDKAFAAFGKVAATSEGSLSLLQVAPATAPLDGGALRLLQRASLARGSTKLARIAGLLASGNPFTRVLEEIDKMTALIAKEGEQDAEQLAWCDSERTTNDASHEEKVTEITSLSEAIAGLKETLNHPETGLHVQVEEAEASLVQNAESQKQATDAREQEHNDFQAQIAHADEAISLLGQAVKVLTRYYKAMDAHQAETVLLQRKQEPETWSGDFEGQSEQGGKVIEMLEFVKGETKKEMDKAIKDDDASKEDYGIVMSELKTDEKDLQESLIRMHKEIAEAEEELAAKKIDLEETEKSKAAIEKYMAKIKPGCDFITANIEAREANRAAETDALAQAKTLLKESPAYKKASAPSF